MQQSRLPPHVLAIILTATLLLFLAGLAVSNFGARSTHPVAPARLLPQAR
jgi:hypothetical protein